MPEDFRSAVSEPRERFYLRTTLSYVGTGLTLSLFVLYRHNVRHLSVSFAPLLLAHSHRLASSCDLARMLRLRRRLRAREDGTELVATGV